MLRGSLGLCSISQAPSLTEEQSQGRLSWLGERSFGCQLLSLTGKQEKLSLILGKRKEASKTVKLKAFGGKMPGWDVPKPTCCGAGEGKLGLDGSN